MKPQGMATQRVARRDFSFGVYIASKPAFHFGRDEVKGSSQLPVHPAGLAAWAGALGAGSRGLALVPSSLRMHKDSCCVPMLI